MGYSRRKLCQLRLLYAKQIKRPIDNVMKLMVLGFTDEDFVSEFKKCYTYIWYDLIRERDYYFFKNKHFKGKRPLLFPSPYRFVLSCAFHKLKRARKNEWVPLPCEDRNKLRALLVANNQHKLSERMRKRAKNAEILQKVAPSYGDSMIQSYFYLRKCNRENIDWRYYVLCEIAKFNSTKYIGFMKHVMASEKNETCRMFAFTTLQKWDKTIHLLKKRKGKKHPSDKLIPHIPDNPAELMDFISKFQIESDKAFNVFLSHRTLDRELIIKVKNLLNKQNLSVYVDWMIDKDGLNPVKFDENTWPILQHRMRHCDKFLYIHTKNCYESEWIPKEIDYAKEIGIPMEVFNVDGASEDSNTIGLKHIDLNGCLS